MSVNAFLDKLLEKAAEQGFIAILLVMVMAVHLWQGHMLNEAYKDLTEYTRTVMYDSMMKNQKIIQESTEVIRQNNQVLEHLMTQLQHRDMRF